MAAHRKQEQEPAGTEVTEVGRDVLRMQLPIQMPGLGHVNTYALLDPRGAAIVDPGLPGPLSWKALTARLRHAGLKLADVHTVVITHSHPDHFGGAARLAEEAGGAEVVTHSAFRSWWHDHSHEDSAAGEHEIHDVDPDDIPAVKHTGPPWASDTPWGGKGYKPPLKRRVMYGLMRSRVARRFGPPAPTTRVKHGDWLKLAGREWQAVHTPGHTLDHLCLHDPETGILLSGDHVLPTITPHISGMFTGRDPLALFFSSLERVAELAVTRVLPAHGHPFDDLAGRAAAIREHHEERLGTLRRVAPSLGRASVEEFSHHLFRPQRWGSMAESETYAHLEHLRLSGLAERVDEGGKVFYEVAPSG